MKHKVDQLIEDWKEIAKHDFEHNDFGNWIKVSEALKAFQQNMKFNFDEDIYRAHAAVINALLIYNLDMSNQKVPQFRRIEELLLQFDTLIYHSTTLETSERLELVQRLVKCVFYTRLGDYLLLASSLKGFYQNRFDQLSGAENLKRSSDYTMAFCAYSLAINHITGEVSNPDLNSGLGKSTEYLIIAELYLLLKKNLDANIFSENEVAQELEDPKFFIRVFYRLLPSSAKNTYVACHTNDLLQSFVANETLVSKWSLFDLRLFTIMDRLWLLRCNKQFLRRFIWLLKHLSPSESEDFFGGMRYFQALPLLPHNLNISSAPENLSVLDIKIFFVRMSHNLKHFDGIINEKGQVFSWIFFRKPLLQQQIFFDASIKVLECKNQKLSLKETISLSNGLDDIRLTYIGLELISKSNVDRTTIIDTMHWLENQSFYFEKKEPNTSTLIADILMELAERYARLVITITTTNKTILDPTSLYDFARCLFPSTNGNKDGISSVRLDDLLVDAANFFLAKRFYKLGQYFVARRHLSEISDKNDSTENYLKLLALVEEKCAHNQVRSTSFAGNEDHKDLVAVTNIENLSPEIKNSDSTLKVTRTRLDFIGLTSPNSISSKIFPSEIQNNDVGSAHESVKALIDGNMATEHILLDQVLQRMIFQLNTHIKLWDSTEGMIKTISESEKTDC